MSATGSASEKIFVIGDIHGCAEELDALLNKLPLTSNSRIVFVGDYIDRGEHSKEVIETIINLKNYYHVTTLMGNHEAMFLDFLKDPGSVDAGGFIYNGGSATLASYSTKNGRYSFPEKHLEFFQNLSLFSQTDKFFFVHAGVPNVALNKIIPAYHRLDLLWIREKFFNSNFKWDKKIIHGHTPVKEVDISEKRINVDTGCVFDNNLSACEVTSQEVFSVPKLGKTKHTYLREEGSKRIATRFEGRVPVAVASPDHILQLETINYSEFGMLLKSSGMTTNALFREGDDIEGEIKITADEPIKFKGKVVRVFKENGEYRYAIQLPRPPAQ